MYQQYVKKVTAYFRKHPMYNSTVHVLGGIGIGFLLAYPFAGSHPIRWGIVFLAISLAGHLYPLFM